MKTLILNGSPRNNGDTSALLSAFTTALSGECMIIDCYSADIAPCIDCRACRSALACPKQDDMQAVYEYLHGCDAVVIASPVHYAELSSGLLTAAGRFQLYSSAMIFRHERPFVKPKKGAVLLAQGGSGGAQRAFETAKLIFDSIGVKQVFSPVISQKTDRLSAADDIEALTAAAELARLISSD